MPRQNLTRDRVIAAAIQLGDTRGVEALTLGNLARELGIQTPSLYKHIASLADLLDEIGVRGARLLTDKITAVAPGKNPAETLLRACTIYRDFAAEHPTHYRALQPTLVKRGAEFRTAAEQLLGAIFPLVAAVGVEKKNLVHAVRGLRSFLHGFADLEAVGGFGMPGELGDSYWFALNAYIAGLSNQTYK